MNLLGGRLAHGRLHLLLTLDSLVVVLISVNRKADGTLAFVAGNQFLRWVEIDNMVLGLCTVLLYYLVTAHLVRDARPRRRGGLLALGALFTAGAYLYALSLGDHEVTNYLHGRFCSESLPPVCRVVAFNDDVFSDAVFLAGFTLLNTTVMLRRDSGVRAGPAVVLAPAAGASLLRRRVRRRAAGNGGDQGRVTAGRGVLSTVPRPGRG
ncbi:hypothetical protein ACFYPB_21010 [Streptomyces olivaceoviridis]|uniref:hypothetical protein n=1 Tax=Streptomyces olivaceoviridis TaxID=1921 RepID=UPI0036C9C4A4